MRLWFLSLIFILVACSERANAPTPVTTVAEAVIMSPTITMTPSATLPPLTTIALLPDAPLATRRPPCADAPPTRMIRNTRGRVMEDDLRPLNVRSGPSTDYRILGRLETSEVFLVVDGPECGGEYVWYLVEKTDGSLRGWIAEGEPDFYYLEPYFP